MVSREIKSEKEDALPEGEVKIVGRSNTAHLDKLYRTKTAEIAARALKGIAGNIVHENLAEVTIEAIKIAKLPVKLTFKDVEFEVNVMNTKEVAK